MPTIHRLDLQWLGWLRTFNNLPCCHASLWSSSTLKMLEQNFFNTIILVTVNIQNVFVVTVSIIVRQTWAFSECLKCPEGESQSVVQNLGSTMLLSISFVLMLHHYFDLAHMWASAYVSHSSPISRPAEENKDRISHGNVPQSFSLAISVIYFLFNLIIHVWQNYRSEASGRTICPSSSFTAREKFWLQRLWHAAAPHHCRLCKSFSARADSAKPSRHKIIFKVVVFQTAIPKILILLKTSSEVLNMCNFSKVQM